MLTVTKANRNNAKTVSSFELLPKDAYVVKILGIREEQNKNGNGVHVKMSFDIAEGKYKGFYQKQYDSDQRDDKKWPNDGVFTISEPIDGSPDWMLQQWDTFWTQVEDSNPGYIFDGDEKKAKGKLFGALMCIEQSEYNGTIYDHTRIKWTRTAQDVRENKYGKLPNDKLIKSSNIASDALSSNYDINVPEGEDEEAPF